MEKPLISIGPGIYIDPIERKDLAAEAREWQVLDARGLESLGVGPSQMRTLMRLEHASYIDVRRITPYRYLLNMATWRKHLAAVKSDPEFWEREENRRRWRIACLAV